MQTINVHRNPSKAQRYRVRSVPTFILVKDGEVVRRRSGMTSKDALRRMWAPGWSIL